MDCNLSNSPAMDSAGVNENQLNLPNLSLEQNLPPLGPDPLESLREVNEFARKMREINNPPAPF